MSNGEFGAGTDNLLESETTSTSTDSSSEDSRSRDGEEQKIKKLTKLRSIKLSRLASLKSSKRKSKSQSDFYFVATSSSSSSSTSSSDSTPTSLSDSSPKHYTKPTSSSDAKQEEIQNLGTISSGCSSSKPVKNLARVHSSRFKKALMRKSPGGSDVKLQESSNNSESNNRSSRQIRNGLVSSNPKSMSAGEKSGKILMRKASLRSVRRVTKLATFKTKMSSVGRQNLELSQFADSKIERATCSSSLKDSKFHHSNELQPRGGREFERTVVPKVCPYTYCSLHGHRHDNVPPLKRFVSMRRRTLKTQMNRRTENQPVVRSKNYRMKKEGSKTSKMVCKGSLAAREIGRVRKPMLGTMESEIGSLASSSDFGQLDGQAQAVASEDKKDMETDRNSIGATEMQLTNQKYMRMWRLLYKNVVDGGVGKDADEQSPDDSKEEPADETNNSGSSQDLSETDLDSTSDAGQDRMELYQIDAIKVVQEAFDEILLPEIQYQSPRDQSIRNGTLEEENAGMGLAENRNISLDEKKTESMVGTKSNQQQAPNRWSNLKKFILLKRFVKALEKVRNINPRKPRYLPLESDLEAEKVHLKTQTKEDKKNTEEWMLDYALRQVISKLGPVQKRRVAILVEAFETVLPVPGAVSPSRPKAAVSMNSLQACNVSHETDHLLLGKISDMKNILKNSVGNIEDSQATFSEKNETNIKIAACNLDKADDNLDVSDYQPDSQDSELDNELSLDKVYHEVPVNGKVLKVHKEIVSRLSYKLQNRDDQQSDAACGKKTGIDKDDILSASTCEPPQEPIEAIEENNRADTPGFDNSKKSNPVGETDTDAAHATQMEKKNNTGLWYLIYKHMASSIAANDGTDQQLLDATDRESQRDEESISRETKIPTDQDFPDHNREFNADEQILELQSIEAIKLVEEAIDEILLPEQENSSDEQSVTSDMVSDQEVSTETQDEESGKTRAVYSEVPDPVERSPKSDNVTALNEDGEAIGTGSKPNQGTQKNWGNLKKLIILRRFIKAVEKVKTFNPRGPRFLPLMSDAEAEKVRLRHQNQEDRKNAEEWMLDYAVQQAVAKLTPARKRKVALLVEAFETVSPKIGR